MDLAAKVRETIQKYCLVSYDDRLLVAVSGGPDSVALLHLLVDLREELRLHLAVAHLQHGIRGEEARQDALFVAGMAQGLALPFYLGEVELLRLRSERGKGNLEAMAREERYRFLGAIAEENGIAKVATAHTRDDQVETLLMRLLRGSGRRGLSGMPALRQLRPDGRGSLLIRPLIEVSREEVLDYLKERGLEYRVDRTNLDPGPLRNWIRLRLLPQLKERIDLHLDERLAHLAQLLREEEETLQRLAQARLRRVISAGSLRGASLLEEDKALQRRIIRLWLEATLGDLKGIAFDHVEEVLRFITHGPPQGTLSLPGGWDLVKQYDAFALARRERRRAPIAYSYTLPLGGELIVPEAGVRIRSTRATVSAPPRLPNDLEAIFDLASLPDRLTVRNFRAGDRFQPLGMQGHKKVKDLFIEKRIPLKIRATLPLLLAGGEILWIPRCGRSAVAKVGPQSRELLEIKLELLSGGDPEGILN